MKKRGQEITRCVRNFCAVDIGHGISTYYNFFSGGDKHKIRTEMNQYYEGVENPLEINLGEEY